MLRKMISLLFCMILIISLPVTAKADIGPKPSVRITFTGIEGETYYGTLSARSSDRTTEALPKVLAFICAIVISFHRKKSLAECRQDEILYALTGPYGGGYGLFR